jgi:hypothetical protein
MKNLTLKYLLVALVNLIIFAGYAHAQCVPLKTPLPPSNPLHYPMPSNRYAVQFQIDGGAWTTAAVNISYYGGTLASPLRNDSGYSTETSLSFVSIPAHANAHVQLRITNLFDPPFRPTDHVSVRPAVKGIGVETLRDGTVRISTSTSSDFNGEQFILWWDRGAEGGAIEGLAFFLDPPYTPPSVGSIKTIYSGDDLKGDLTSYDTLDFEGTIVITKPGKPDGAVAFVVPANILTIFFGPGAWVQGKLRFEPALTPSGAHKTRKLYGPGVLDVSRFDYLSRACSDDDEGYYALTSQPTDAAPSAILNNFHVDGIIITDHNHAATDLFFDSTVNNVKTLGWNGENAALRLGDNTTASNLFIRSGDDSLMMWGAPVTVTNATVWQNYNGGVVNLGWSNNLLGNGSLIDRLYVVRTDWLIPTNVTDANWTALPSTDQPLQGQNNAVFASLMVPGTSYGNPNPPTYRNIFIDDVPRVLFSLKILPPICAPTGLVCVDADLTASSTLKLNIENLFTPQSVVRNSIGFQNVPAGYTYEFPKGTTHTVPANFTLAGTMCINLTNAFTRLSNGVWLPLTSGDAFPLGKIKTNGDDVNVNYKFDVAAFLALFAGKLP